MSKRTEVQIINVAGKPAFVVIPYADFVKLYADRFPIPSADSVPHEVMRAVLKDGVSLARAWREHLGLTQAEVAKRMGVSQPALSQLEAPNTRMRALTRTKLATALGVTPAQLK